MDLAEEQRQIRKRSALALLPCAAVSTGSVLLLPEVMSFPEALAERLAFAIQTSSIHFLLVLVAVRLVSGVE